MIGREVRKGNVRFAPKADMAQPVKTSRSYHQSADRCPGLVMSNRASASTSRR